MSDKMGEDILGQEREIAGEDDPGCVRRMIEGRLEAGKRAEIRSQVPQGGGLVRPLVVGSDGATAMSPMMIVGRSSRTCRVSRMTTFCA